jgi:hypothetical protein
MEILKLVNVGLSFGLELCLLAALGFWGFHSGSGWGMKITLGLGAPLLAALAWGLFAAPASHRRLSGLALTALEIVLLGAGAVALFAAGQTRLAWVYALFLLVNRVLWIVWRQ